MAPALAVPVTSPAIGNQVGCYFYGDEEFENGISEHAVPSQSNFVNGVDPSSTNQAGGMLAESFTGGHVMRYFLFGLIAILGVLSYRKYLVTRTETDLESDTEV